MAISLSYVSFHLNNDALYECGLWENSKEHFKRNIQLSINVLVLLFAIYVMLEIVMYISCQIMNISL